MSMWNRKNGKTEPKEMKMKIQKEKAEKNMRI